MEKENTRYIFGATGELTIYESNKYIIAEDTSCQHFIQEIRKTAEFLDDLALLSFGRDYIICGSNVFSLQRIITSLGLTVESIISCCESACIADANTLLRKYRDDLFFYLYVIAYDAKAKEDYVGNQALKMKNRIQEWIENNLSNLSINEVLQTIGNMKNVYHATKKYNLQSSFSQISSRLNNYVHSNGYSFYNYGIIDHNTDMIAQQLLILQNDIRYITTSFLFLLILTSPQYVMSTDYVDYLESNLKPPENVQYLVAP